MSPVSAQLTIFWISSLLASSMCQNPRTSGFYDELNTSIWHHLTILCRSHCCTRRDMSDPYCILPRDILTLSASATPHYLRRRYRAFRPCITSQFTPILCLPPWACPSPMRDTCFGIRKNGSETARSPRQSGGIRKQRPLSCSFRRNLFQPDQQSGGGY